MNRQKRAFSLGKRTWLTVFVLVILIPATIYFFSNIGGRTYYLVSLLIIAYTMFPFFLVFEKRKPQARELVVLAVLCALAVASRAAFKMVDHFKPMTAIIMISGIAFGPEAGFLVGAVSGFTSNFFFGQGPWTPWQMFAFGTGGFLAGLFFRLNLLSKNRLPLSVFGFFAVVLFVGPLLDSSHLFTMVSEINSDTIKATYLSGLPVNLIHGLATFLTLFFFSKPLFEKLDRIQVKYGMLED